MNEQLYSIFTTNYDNDIGVSLNLTITELIDYLYDGCLEDLEDCEVNDSKSWSNDHILKYLGERMRNLDWDFIIIRNDHILKKEDPITDKQLLSWFKKAIEREIKNRSKND